MSTITKTGNFNTIVASNMEMGMTKQEAFAKVCREHPKARQAMVAEFNQKHGRRST